MANSVKLAGVEYPLGDLTGAHLEDHYDAVVTFSQVTSVPSREQFSAIVTLLHLALAAGGLQKSRDEVRELVRFPDLPRIASAVGVALGFEQKESGPGEGGRP